MNASAYQKRFRQAQKGADETHKIFKGRLQDYLMYYVDAKGTDTLDAMIVDVICEQLMSVLDPEIRSFVLSKQAKNAEECCHFTDLYHEMTRSLATGQVQSTAQTLAGGLAKKGGSAQPQQSASNGNSKLTGNKGLGTYQNPQKVVRCFHCNSLGHKRNECPVLSKPSAGVCDRCLCFHPFHLPCDTRGNTGVYRAALHDDVRECMNEFDTMATGNF